MFAIKMSHFRSVNLIPKRNRAIDNLDRKTAPIPNLNQNNHSHNLARRRGRQ